MREGEAMDVQGMRVLITGGTRGIGRAAAHAFASRGATVTLGFRSDVSAAEATLAELPGAGHGVVQADVSQPADCERLVDTADERMGGLDVVVNNAGVGGRHRIDEDTPGDWQAAWSRMLTTNLIGPANIAYHAGRLMMKRGGGRMVFVSSRGAFRGEPDQPAYGASKAGLNSLAGSLAQQLAPYGVFVGTVAPGFVETDLAKERLKGAAGDAIRSQSPHGRVAKPDEVAHAIVFLASRGAEWTTGTIIDVNGASYLRT
jgi:NAD(P)-dependent dehydrogenase (short-subunit alcohol dehydrogenase family)